MNSQTEMMPGAVTSVGASAWKPRLFQIAYLGASAVAMIGWLIALSWAGLSLLRFFF
jgi:hypothetical protein